jgi:bifunctional ADP-heptose synthase (sugar kinase/adenylyltransferase)
VEEIVGFADVTSWGGKVVTIPLLEGYSSTSLIDKIPPGHGKI